MAEFTPWPALAGGALIGAAATLMLWVSGRIAGVSGLLAGLFAPTRAERRFSAAFVSTLVLTGLVAVRFVPSTLGEPTASLPVIGVAGLLVGVGTRLGGGCTSGHGVCGISRLSSRSALATAVFVTVGILTASVVHGLGAGP